MHFGTWVMNLFKTLKWYIPTFEKNLIVFEILLLIIDILKLLNLKTK